MYCRTCGNKMNDNAELCVKCGVRRNVGDDFCQVCGARTVAGMTACKKCGAKLMKAMSSVQIKKKAVSKGRKTIGTILLVFAIILPAPPRAGTSGCGRWPRPSRSGDRQSRDRPRRRTSFRRPR